MPYLLGESGVTGRELPLGRSVVSFNIQVLNLATTVSNNTCSGFQKLFKPGKVDKIQFHNIIIYC